MTRHEKVVCRMVWAGGLSANLPIEDRLADRGRVPVAPHRAEAIHRSPPSVQGVDVISPVKPHFRVRRAPPRWQALVGVDPSGRVRLRRLRRGVGRRRPRAVRRERRAPAAHVLGFIWVGSGGSVLPGRVRRGRTWIRGPVVHRRHDARPRAGIGAVLDPRTFGCPDGWRGCRDTASSSTRPSEEIPLDARCH